MIKVVACIIRKQGISLEDFYDQWQNRHRNLLLEYKDILKIKKHYQMLPDNGPFQAGLNSLWSPAPVLDGVDETWFESEDAFLNLQKDPAAVAAMKVLREDELKFVDHSKTFGWVVRDATVIG